MRAFLPGVLLIFLLLCNLSLIHAMHFILMAYLFFFACTAVLTFFLISSTIYTVRMDVIEIKKLLSNICNKRRRFLVLKHWSPSINWRSESCGSCTKCLQGQRLPFFFKHCANKFAFLFEHVAFLLNKEIKNTFN